MPPTEPSWKWPLINVLLVALPPIVFVVVHDAVQLMIGGPAIVLALLLLIFGK